MEAVIESIVKDFFACRPDPSVLQRRVNEQMAAYEAKEQREKELMAKRSQIPDEEGFITVHNPHGAVFGKEGDSEETDEVGLKDFYRFQTRVTSKSKKDELRERFEEDKARLLALRKVL